MKIATTDVLDRWAQRLTFAAMSLLAAAVVAILALLIYSCVPLLASGELFTALTGKWRPYASPGEYGIGAMVAGSVLLACVALVLAFPLAVGVCAFAHGLAPKPLARCALAVVHFMTSIPTVVYGFVSVFLLVPLLRQSFGSGTGYSLLAAGLTLCVLILPTIVLLIHVTLQQIDPSVRVACAALGMTPAQTQIRVLFPLARRGLLAAAVLGFCRAIGDTLIALMVAGGAPQTPASLLDSIRTLTSHIAMVVATDWHSPEFRSLAAAGLVLFLVTACLTSAIRRLCRPARPRQSSNA